MVLLLERKVVELNIVDHASDNTIGRVLKKTSSRLISNNNGSSRRKQASGRYRGSLVGRPVDWLDALHVSQVTAIQLFAPFLTPFLQQRCDRIAKRLVWLRAKMTNICRFSFRRLYRIATMMSVFYSALNFAYRTVFGQPQMLHCALYREEGQTLMQGQIYLTEASLALLGEIGGKRLLDIGCGNGVQTLYVHATRAPAWVHGVDLNAMHIEIATAAAAKVERPHMSFAVDDAQRLVTVADESIDLVLCIESAHHYPDKDAFLAQVGRVLKPGGQFVIADLLLRDGVRLNWLDRRLSLLYWRLARYREALPGHSLRLIVEEELTGRLTTGSQDARRWVGARSGRSLSLVLGRLIIRSLAAFYLYQLTNRLHYYLLAGVKA